MEGAATLAEIEAFSAARPERPRDTASPRSSPVSPATPDGAKASRRSVRPIRWSSRRRCGAAGARGERVLIEATCNQVNQEGGYTGMTPADFRRFVEAIAAKVGYDPSRIVLGGDHLGPNPWKRSAGGRGDGARRGDDRRLRARRLRQTASRRQHGLRRGRRGACRRNGGGARGCAGGSRRSGGRRPAPVYVIGTEVPVPGGAQHALEALTVTEPEAALRTVELHRKAFGRRGLEGAFERSSPSSSSRASSSPAPTSSPIDPERRGNSSRSRRTCRSVVFEAHSTDYQPAAALEALVRDGFAILKVGPGSPSRCARRSTGSTRSPRSFAQSRRRRPCKRPWKP